MMRSPASITSVAKTPLPWISERRASIFFFFFLSDLSLLAIGNIVSRGKGALWPRHRACATAPGPHAGGA